MPKVLTAILISAGFLFLGCLKNDSSLTTNKVVATPVSTPEDPSRLSEREYATLVAIIGERRFVIKNSANADFMGEVSPEAVKSHQGLLPETIADYNKKNFSDKSSVSFEIEGKFPTQEKYFLLSQEELKSQFDYKKSNATDTWKSFKEKYGTDGYHTVSRVGFSNDGKQALAFVSFTCGSLCADGTYYFLIHQDGRWKIESKNTVWVS
ncbi:MAG: hypothetical protein ABL959_12600 [Pyrinomonadaceae bacterium]